MPCDRNHAEDLLEDMMQAYSKTYTTQTILTSLGFSDPMDAARQQARMILLGRRARYESEMSKFEREWGKSLEEMRERYLATGAEDAAVDDDYLTWQWYADAKKIIDEQLDVLLDR